MQTQRTRTLRISRLPSWLRQSAVVTALGVLFSAAPVPLTAQETTPSGSTSTPLVIGVGDTLNVTVFDTPSLSFQGRVSEAGTIEAPVLGAVPVAGLTTAQAGARLEERLRTGDIMPQPSVTVLDTSYATQGVVVLGEVRTPGTYVLLGPHSLYDALAAAGGPSDNEGSTIEIAHHGDPDHPEVVDVRSPNYSDRQRITRVYPGDTVFVSKAETVYVVGDVGHPGAYFMAQGKQLKILEVLALAQGTTLTTAESRCSIVRTSSTGAVSTIPVNIKKIKSFKAPDIALQSNDILVLPHSAGKVLLNAVLPNAAASATSAVTTALIVR